MATWTTGFTNYLQPGVSVTFSVTWPAGEDPGLQTVLARPKGPVGGWYSPPGTPVVTHEVTTENVSVAARPGPPKYYGWGGYPSQVVPRYTWTYMATVRNSGQVATWCELIGGKVV